MSTLKTNNIQHVDRSDPSIIISTDGGVSIAGTLTYEDVTSVDSVGIVTARGLSIFGDTTGLNVTGVSTFAGNINANGNIVGDDSTNITGVNQVIATALYTADAIIHRGESGDDTKIRFPQDDTVTITTSNEERIRIDSSGRVLIGTSATLHSGTMKLQVANTDASSAITINRYSNDAYSPYLYFQNSRSGTIGGNTAVQDGDLLGRIYFNGNGGDGMYSGAYITATVDGGVGTNDMPGRLGLWTSADGTAAPVERLRITKTGAVVIGDSMSQIGASCKVQVREDQNGAHMELVRSYDSASTPTRLRFSNSRGTAASPTIVGDGDDIGEIRFNGYDGNDYLSAAASIFVAVDGTPGSDDMPGRIELHTTPDGNTTPVERMRITHHGKVLINTTSTDGITSSSGAAGLRVRSGGIGSNYAEGAISTIGTGGDFYAMTMRDSNNNGWGLYTVFSSSVDRLQFGYYDAPNSINKSVLKLDESGHVTAMDGNFIVGTAGHGLSFAETSNHGTTTPSEILDDYEEGTWNPTFQFGGGNTGINHSQQEARYTKIGNQVCASFVIGITNKGSSTGNWTLNGLPYTIINDSGDRANGIVTYYGDMSGLNTHVVLYNTGNTTNVYGYYSDGSSASVTGLTDSQFTNNSHMRGHIIYRTSAS